MIKHRKNVLATLDRVEEVVASVAATSEWKTTTGDFVLGVDPGKSGFAWALFRDGKLESCGRNSEQTIGAFARAALAFGTRLRVVIERPQIYVQSRWKGDPNDLVDVAMTVGALRHALRESRVELVLPREWKGTVPKDVMGDRILLSLDVAERERVHMLGLSKKFRLDVVDAIGIALRALDRLS